MEIAEAARLMDNLFLRILDTAREQANLRESEDAPFHSSSNRALIPLWRALWLNHPPSSFFWMLLLKDVAESEADNARNMDLTFSTGIHSRHETWRGNWVKSSEFYRITIFTSCSCTMNRNDFLILLSSASEVPRLFGFTLFWISRSLAPFHISAYRLSSSLSFLSIAQSRFAISCCSPWRYYVGAPIRHWSQALQRAAGAQARPAAPAAAAARSQNALALPRIGNRAAALGRDPGGRGAPGRLQTESPG